jgi:Putative transposase
VHCVVAGGGLSPDGTRWIACKPGFFLPVRVLSRLFRRLFLAELGKAFNSGELQFFSALETLNNPMAFARYLAPLKIREWVVYAKPPFAGPQQVLDYWTTLAAIPIGLLFRTTACWQLKTVRSRFAGRITAITISQKP